MPATQQDPNSLCRVVARLATVSNQNLAKSASEHSRSPNSVQGVAGEAPGDHVHQKKKNEPQTLCADSQLAGNSFQPKFGNCLSVQYTNSSKNVLRLSHHHSCSSDYAELGHFMFLFYKGWRRNIQRFLTHMHSHCFAHYTFCLQPRSQGPLSSSLEKVPWLRLLMCLLDFCRFQEND